MEEVYYLKFIMEDGSVRYMGHSTYIFDEKPSFRSLMDLKDAKTKRTKMIKDMNRWADFNPDERFQDIEICKATITYEV